MIGPHGGKIRNSTVARTKHLQKPKRLVLMDHWSYGQNFLIDESVGSLIVHQARLRSGDRILEIGPGTGNLTAQLLKTGVDRVLAVEADSALVPGLTERFQRDIDTGKLKLVAGDATRLDVHKLLVQEGQLDLKWKVVANLPFNITSEILRLLLPLGDVLAEVFVMLQLEAAQRLSGEQQGSSNFRAMSVLVDFYSTAVMGMKIDRSAFHPPPNVDCAMVLFRLKQAQDRPAVPSESQFLRFVDTCFSSRRKTVRNNLKQAFDSAAIEAAVRALGLEWNVRPQELDVDKFAALCCELYK